MPDAPSTPPRILLIGAHPDDADFKAGGCVALWRAAGCPVRMVSVADGAAGHHEMRGPPLAARRKAEALAAAAVTGAEYEILGLPDGGVTADLEYRARIIRLIRGYRPDLVVTHRPNDYHPDHRWTSVLVQDAAYLVTVPAVCPDTPALTRDPVYAYFSDDFRKPCPFEATVAVDIGPVWDVLVETCHRHDSQMYEWLPWNMWGGWEGVPAASDPTGRRQWLSRLLQGFVGPLADRCRAVLAKWYGPERAAGVRWVEAFEGGEYGRRLDDAAVRRLFPFLPVR